jgi:hypothetical protein
MPVEQEVQQQEVQLDADTPPITREGTREVTWSSRWSQFP